MSLFLKFCIANVICFYFIIFTASADVFELANGYWGADVENVPEGIDAKELEKFRGCTDSPVIISVDKESMRYKAIHTGEGNFVSEGPILNHGYSWLSVRYDGETRLMKNGEPQIWHMIFVSEDKFYWVVGPGFSKESREGVVGTARIRCQNLIG